MGGLMRLRPQTIVETRRNSYTCTTKGCPEPAVLILPLNENALHAYEATGYNRQDWRQRWTTEQGLVVGQGIEMRLCRKCIRTLATALPVGMRLAGARLRYPEIAPDVRAAEDIPGTIEWREAHPRAAIRDAVVAALHDNNKE